MNHSKLIDPPIHALDFGFLKRVHKKLNALLNAQIKDENGNVIGIVDYADGNTVFKFKSQGGGSVRIEQWSPTPNPPYAKGNIVFYQPDGTPGAMTFYALQDVPNGVSPATGAPYWGSFPLGIPGAWL